MTQITPAFVREAYSLLKQSIIHVEQDDIEFDEEELEGERSKDKRNGRPPNGHGNAYGKVDTDITEEQLAAPDETPYSAPRSAAVLASSPTRAGGSGAQLMPTSPAVPPTLPPQPKRKLKITHDEYVQLQSMIVLHLSAHERETGRGIDRDELVDWYLEQKEEEMRDVSELDYQNELVKKVLKRLVKVSSLFFPCMLNF